MGRGIRKKYVLTNEFIEAIGKYLKKTNLHMWRLATGVNLHPTTLSHAIHGNFVYETVLIKMDAIARQIGYKEICYTLLQSQSIDTQIVSPKHGKIKTVSTTLG